MDLFQQAYDQYEFVKRGDIKDASYNEFDAAKDKAMEMYDNLKEYREDWAAAGVKQDFDAIYEVRDDLDALSTVDPVLMKRYNRDYYRMYQGLAEEGGDVYLTQLENGDKLPIYLTKSGEFDYERTPKEAIDAIYQSTGQDIGEVLKGKSGISVEYGYNERGEFGNILKVDGNPLTGIQSEMEQGLTASALDYLPDGSKGRQFGEIESEIRSLMDPKSKPGQGDLIKFAYGENGEMDASLMSPLEKYIIDNRTSEAAREKGLRQVLDGSYDKADQKENRDSVYASADIETTDKDVANRKYTLGGRGVTQAADQLGIDTEEAHGVLNSVKDTFGALKNSVFGASQEKFERSHEKVVSDPTTLQNEALISGLVATRKSELKDLAVNHQYGALKEEGVDWRGRLALFAKDQVNRFINWTKGNPPGTENDNALTKFLETQYEDSVARSMGLDSYTRSYGTWQDNLLHPIQALKNRGTGTSVAEARATQVAADLERFKEANPELNLETYIQRDLPAVAKEVESHLDRLQTVYGDIVQGRNPFESLEYGEERPTQGFDGAISKRDELALSTYEFNLNQEALDAARSGLPPRPPRPGSDLEVQPLEMSQEDLDMYLQADLNNKAQMDKTIQDVQLEQEGEAEFDGMSM